MKLIRLEKALPDYCKPLYIVPSVYLKREVKYEERRMEYMTLVIGFFNYRLILSTFLRHGAKKESHDSHFPKWKKYWF